MQKARFERIIPHNSKSHKRAAFTPSCKARSSASSPEPSQRAFGLKSCHARAFTLAEVLITLAVIVVVGVLTITLMVNESQKGKDFSKLKNMYETLKLAEASAISEHGPMANWNWSGNAQSVFEKYFRENLKDFKECSIKKQFRCFSDSYRYKDGDSLDADSANESYEGVISPDGVALRYYKYPPNTPNFEKGKPYPTGYFFVDLNGKAPPNVLGEDAFIFDVFASEIGVVPEGSYKSGINMSQEYISRTCEVTGHNCCAMLLAR